jgi:DNA-directed RNA polymerase specialized sigma24 family protein
MSSATPLTPAQLMVDPANTRVIQRTLLFHGMSKKQLQDATQDVRVKLLQAFARGVAPADLGEMMAFSTKVARDHAIDVLRQTESDARDLAEPCAASEYHPLRPVYEQRDAVDAGRQLEALAQLFRDGKMPEHGVDILEGFASGRSYAEIGESLGITADIAEWRMRTMRKRYRKHMVKLGLWPTRAPLHLVVSKPGAMARLRTVA